MHDEKVNRSHRTLLLEANHENKNNGNYRNPPVFGTGHARARGKQRFDSAIFQTSLMRKA